MILALFFKNTPCRSYHTPAKLANRRKNRQNHSRQNEPQHAHAHAPPCPAPAGVDSCGQDDVRANGFIMLVIRHKSLQKIIPDSHVKYAKGLPLNKKRNRPPGCTP